MASNKQIYAEHGKSVLRYAWGGNVKLLDKLFKTKVQTSLERDLITASDWVAASLNFSGYNADYTLESMREIDRFFDEQSSPDGIISQNRGQILFALGAYVGQTAIKLYGGDWITDDSDPQGEINVSVQLCCGSMIWPVIRCMKRYQNGAEDGIYAYLLTLGSKLKNT